MHKDNALSYQICGKTVMDTIDPYITLDANIVSNHYWDFQNVIKPNCLRTIAGGNS